MPIRHATATDIPAIMHIVRTTVASMHENGNNQWDHTYPTPCDFLQDITSGTLYIDETETGTMRGFVCIDTREPEEYAPLLWQAHPPSLILHRMAISPDFRRRGIGKSLLAFAETKASATHARSIKTDTHTTNPAMNALLQTCGYRTVGLIRFKGKDKPFICYEKIVTDNQFNILIINRI